MTLRLHLFLDARGVSRSIAELWVPDLDADSVWFIGPAERAPDPDLARDLVPVMTLAPLEVAAVVAEPIAEERRVLAVFASLEALQDAAMAGLGPAEVTLLHMGDPEAGERVAADVHVDAEQRVALRFLERKGFSFSVQPIPNVTPRPWSVTELTP